MKTGQKVEVKNKTLSGKEFIEGTATLLEKLQDDPEGEYWLVRFDDGEVAKRWIPKTFGEGGNATTTDIG